MRDQLTPEPEDEGPAPGASLPPGDGVPAPAPFNSERDDDRGPRAGEYGGDYPPAGGWAVDLSRESGAGVELAAEPRRAVAGFGVRQRMAGSAPLTNVLFTTGPTLNQGNEGACVGFRLGGRRERDDAAALPGHPGAAR
jgi:hypothetical protein